MILVSLHNTILRLHWTVEIYLDNLVIWQMLTAIDNGFCPHFCVYCLGHQPKWYINKHHQILTITISVEQLGITTFITKWCRLIRHCVVLEPSKWIYLHVWQYLEHRPHYFQTYIIFNVKMQHTHKIAMSILYVVNFVFLKTQVITTCKQKL